MTDTRTVWLVITALLVTVLALIASATWLISSGAATIESVNPWTTVIAGAVGVIGGLLANTRGTGPPV